jgi:competence ComEA-like helix-hairpin-helix protein
MGWPTAWLFAFEKRVLGMLKKQIRVGLCILLIGLLMVPGFVVAGDKRNINTASKDKLCELNGVDVVIADGIIERREKVGPFKSVEEIIEVKGIGDKTFLKIKEFIVVE